MPEVDPSELKRAHAGSDWLDRHWPRARLEVPWFGAQVIRLDELDVGKPCRCVLGQVGGYALRRRGWTASTRVVGEGEELTFEGGITGYDALTTPVDFWIRSDPEVREVVRDLHELFSIEPGGYADEAELGFDGSVPTPVWVDLIARRRLAAGDLGGH